MAYDPNMARWIMASCRTWFKENVQNEIPIFFEYTRHKNINNNETTPDDQQYAEFRLNGPDYRQITSNEVFYDIQINVLCSQALNEGSSDDIELVISSLYVCFTTTIPVYRYGPATNELNDNSFVGCLFISDEKDGQVNVSRFGQGNPDTLFSQASIEAGYRLRLKP